MGSDLGLPEVTIHYAQTLDGRIATRTGRSRWIGGRDSVVYAHRLRADHDAVLVGIGTVLCDDPQLTVRHVVGPDPLRVIVDSKLRTPLESAVLSNGAAAGTLIAANERAPEEQVERVRALGARVELLRSDEDGRVDLAHLMETLGRRGVRSILVEGGARVITSALRLGIAKRLITCVAPKILGSGVEAVGDLLTDDLSQALTFREYRVERLGDDLIVDALLEPGAAFGAQT